MRIVRGTIDLCPTELTLGTCTNSADPTFFLFGALGVCDYSPANPMATSPAPAAGQRDWATDEPLTSDFACQHWMSALLLSESNNFGVHNLFSAMGPSSSAAPGTIGQQLTMAASAVRGNQYISAPIRPVRSITDGCAVGTLARRIADGPPHSSARARPLIPSR